ncbi:MAG: hypothetical protein HPY85_17805, partial [Anaerolineae bacterium]|nr:hypothetical protein [Anaerolineae bacterium]
EDNFFELGGDSLMSMQMILEVEQQMGVEVPNAFFQNATIRNLVRTISKRVDRLGSEKTKLNHNATKQWRKRQTVFEAMRKKAISWIQRLFVYINAGMSYRFSLRMLRLYCRSRLVQKLVYQEERDLFHAFHASVSSGIKPCFSVALQGNLMGKIITASQRYERKGRHPARWRWLRDWESICIDTRVLGGSNLLKVSGFEFLGSAYQAGSGVILIAYHGNTIKQVTPLVKEKLGLADIQVISPRFSSRREGLHQGKEENQAIRQDYGQSRYGGDALLTAYRSLKVGQVVRTYVDNGRSSRGDTPVTVSGKQYLMRRGWAELAVRADVPVIPVHSVLQADGSLQIDFLPPLQRSNMAGDIDRQVHNLMEQYAKYLSDCMQQLPQSLKWNTIKNHQKQPDSPLK